MIDGGCGNPASIQSWIDLRHSMPKCILDLIAYAKLNTTAGVVANSSDYGTATWSANSFTINSAPVCAALGTDNLQNVADADQWNFQHLTAMLDSSTAIPLRKVLFLRGGTQWKMSIAIDFGGSTYTDVQLGFRDNAATRGDAQGTWPVVEFSGSFTGVCTLEVVLKTLGACVMGLRVVTGGTTSMFEMEWMVVP